MKKFAAVILLLAFLCLSSCASESGQAPGCPDTPDAGLPPLTQSPSLSESKIFGESRVSFLAVGDNIIHESVFTDAAKRADAEHPKYNFAVMYEDLAQDIAAADLAFVNQESPISSSFSVKGYPDFNSPAEAGETLVALGFDIVNIANNHMLDMGQQGYIDTIAFWNEQPVTMIGGYTEDDYDQIRVVEKNGIRIALLSYTTFVNYAHQSSLSSSSGYVIPYADADDIRRQTALAHECADAVVVSMHWGTEDQFAPDAQQKKLTSILAECGVDVVIGHHPHVIQKVSEIDRTDGGKMLVIYSLGNFISTMHYSQNMLGGMINFDLVMDSDGKVSYESPVFTPIVTQYSLRRDSLHIYKFSDYSEELARQHGSTLKNDFSYSILKRYITNNIDSRYLPSDFS